MPPPAITMLNTLGQWSRPAVPLIFGVRPNSRRDAHQRRIEQLAAIQIANQRGKGLVKHRQLALHAAGDVVVMVPAAVRQRDESHARFDQSPREQHACTGFIAAVLVADLRRLPCRCRMPRAPFAN